MAVYGYHRTSTREQHLDRGLTSINEFCKKNGIELTEMFTDQQTGKNFDRPDYKTMKRMAKNQGDVIILSELDRLGRNAEDILKELRHYSDKGVRIMILEIPTTLIDYSNLGNEMSAMIMKAINNMLIEMYATFAHAEMLKREKRQYEGIEAKKNRGEWDDYGRPPVISDNEIDKFCESYLKFCNEGLKAVQIMQKLDMKKTSFYKYRKICIDKYFPLFYKQILQEKMTPTDCMLRLGLKENEYNAYIGQCTSLREESVARMNSESSALELDKYIQIVQKLLLMAQKHFDGNDEMLQSIQQHLDYLPSLHTLPVGELQTIKQQYEELLVYLKSNMPTSPVMPNPVKEPEQPINENTTEITKHEAVIF